MRFKRLKGIILILAGLGGAVFTLTYDFIMDKPFYIGTKAVTGFVVCGLLVLYGIWFIIKKPRK